MRGANRDEKKIPMAQCFPNSRHYLTYRHSLRVGTGTFRSFLELSIQINLYNFDPSIQSYASILYLRLPQGFRIILRGKDVVHHSLVNDLMFTQEHTYKPHGGGDNIQKESYVSCYSTEL